MNAHTIVVGIFIAVAASSFQFASAGIIATDSFLSGGNPATGEYAAGVPLDTNGGRAWAVLLY